MLKVSVSTIDEIGLLIEDLEVLGFLHYILTEDAIQYSLQFFNSDFNNVLLWLNKRQNETISSLREIVFSDKFKSDKSEGLNDE